MIYWVLGAVAIIVILTLVGASMVRRNPDTAWEVHEDRPIGPGTDL